MTSRVDRESRLSLRGLIVPGIIMLAFCGVGVAMWQSSGYIQALLFFGYIGASIGVGLGLYATLPRRHKPWARRLTLLLVGAFLFGVAAVLGQENMQLEGFWFGLLLGVFQAAVIHYLIAKVFGPLLFGRLWCGWACWTVMVLDLLPFSRPRGRVSGRWGQLRYLHLALSLGLVLLLFALGYRLGATGPTAVYWFLGGNALYYAAGVALAFALKDHRAFCKYACPVAAVLKLTARFSLLKVKGDAGRCNACNACIRLCPMDIRIPDYVLAGRRVLSTECSLCQTCITVCPEGALKLSLGLDLGGQELLRVGERSRT